MGWRLVKLQVRATGSAPGRIVPEIERILVGDMPQGGVPELWDGKAAGRIVAALLEKTML